MHFAKWISKKVIYFKSTFKINYETHNIFTNRLPYVEVNLKCISKQALKMIFFYLIVVINNMLKYNLLCTQLIHETLMY